MISSHGIIDEIYLQGNRAARIRCPRELVPAPGQYTLAQAHPTPDSPLPYPIFSAGTWPQGFYASSPLPARWAPGQDLVLRGPLGKGFHIPPVARKIALVAWEPSCPGLLSLIETSMAQKAAISLLTNTPVEIPDEVEMIPLQALPEACAWADYLAIETSSLNLPHKNLFAKFSGYSAEILLHTPIACGGLAECAVCAIETRQGWRLTCKDGPVFDLKTLL